MTGKIAEIIGWNNNLLEAWENEEGYHGNISYRDDSGHSHTLNFHHDTVDGLIEEINNFIKQNTPKWLYVYHTILKKNAMIKYY